MSFRAKILSLVLIAYASEAEPQTAKEIIQGLSIEQKIEQMMIVGFAGTDFASNLGPRLRSLRPGSLIVFSRNIKTPIDLAKTLESAQAQALLDQGLPLLIMIDQEGGQVSRIKTRPLAPSALAMGRTQNLKLIESVGETTGKLLRAIGINMNLAPVLDVANPDESHFIGNRAFGGDPVLVARSGMAFSNGLKKAGVLPTGKHFPGHGGTRQDSHKVQATKMESLSALMANDLLPFSEYSKLPGTKALMVAHVAYPSLDPSGLPATYSKAIVTDLLRDQLGFNGIVITDDLEMSGAAGVGHVGERALRAVKAGVDMVMIAWSHERQRLVKTTLIDAVRSGELSEDQINDSLTRILKAKLQLKADLATSGSPDLNLIRKHLSRLQELSVMVSRDNFDRATSAFREGFVKPSHDTSVFVFSADLEFFEGFQKVHPKKARLFNLRSLNVKDVETVMDSHPDALGVYYASGTITARRAANLPKWVKRRMILVNTTHSGLISNKEDFAGLVDLNTRSAMAGFWLAQYLFTPKAPLREPSTEARRSRSKPQKRRSRVGAI